MCACFVSLEVLKIATIKLNKHHISSTCLCVSLCVCVCVRVCVHVCVCVCVADLVQELYAGTWCQMRADGSVSPSFEMKSRVRQGCVLSPLPFNCFMDKVLREVGGRPPY